MPYLIDGYNLLYAMGVLHGRVGPDGLAKARLNLLGILAVAHATEAADVTVVFDAAGAPPGVVDHDTYQGLNIRYAVHHAQADDLIEELIQHDSAPRHLSVVSDDHRLQRAARQRGCVVLSCADYLDLLERVRRRRRPPPQTPPEKKEHLSDAETQAWLKEFADLNEDPQLRELSEPHPFDDELDER